MESVKRWLLGLGICLLLAVLLGACCFSFARPWYYRLFYPWDRYTGTVAVEVDGKPAAFSVEGDSVLHPVRVTRQGASRANISMHAGDHGVYGCLLQVEGLDKPIRLSSLKWNWQVIRYEVHISIDREKGTVSAFGTVWETNDRGVFREGKIDETISLSQERLSFAISW